MYLQKVHLDMINLELVRDAEAFHCWTTAITTAAAAAAAGFYSKLRVLESIAITIIISN